LWWWLACHGPPVVPQADPGWRSGSALPVARQECGVAALDGRIVVVGGFDDRLAMLDTVHAYDPAQDLWSELAPLPQALHHPNLAVLDGQLHVAGALGEAFLEISAHYVYDPAQDSWSELPEMPDELAVGSAAVGVLDGQLHLVGGLRSNRAVASHVRWDPGSGQWEELAPAPHARDHGAAGVIDGVLVVVAGRQGTLSSLVPATDLWDPETGWSRADLGGGAPIPTPRGGVAAAASEDGWLSVLGGEGNAADPSGVFAEHERYDPSTDSWDRLPPMPTPRHGTAAAWLDGILWVPGGAEVAAFGATSTNEGWRP
jgi:N-acetylneuraminic acid mutarotase